MTGSAEASQRLCLSKKSLTLPLFHLSSAVLEADPDIEALPFMASVLFALSRFDYRVKVRHWFISFVYFGSLGTLNWLRTGTSFV